MTLFSDLDATEYQYGLYYLVITFPYLNFLIAKGYFFVRGSAEL
jgi:hypothetical protein